MPMHGGILRSKGVVAGGAGAVGADAIIARVFAVAAPARVVVARGAGAVLAVAGSARVCAVRARAGGALVVVDAVLGGVFAVAVPVVQIVDVVLVHYRIVPAAWTVSMLMRFGVAVRGKHGHVRNTSRCLLLARRLSLDRLSVASRPVRSAVQHLG